MSVVPEKLRQRFKWEMLQNTLIMTSFVLEKQHFVAEIKCEGEKCFSDATIVL